MKTTEEKTNFRNQFLKLGQGHIISTDESNDVFWSLFWLMPTCANDVYELITVADIKKVRQQNLMNIIQLTRKLCHKVIFIAKESKKFGNNKKETIELLNCVRFLIKVLPFIFELAIYPTELEREIFWNNDFDPMQFLQRLEASRNEDEPEDNNNWERVLSPDQATNSIAVNLMSSLVDLLFIRNFTVASSVSKSSATGKDNKLLHVWEPGIGSTSKYQQPNVMIDSNRTEILKLLLTLCSNSLYQQVSSVTTQGSKFLTLLVTVTPKIELLTLVSSLLNIACRSSKLTGSENGLVFEKQEYSETRHLCVTYSIQLLTLMVVYPLPQKSELKFLSEGGLCSKPYNMARAFMGKIHKENELLFITSSLIDLLKVPLINAKDQETDTFSLLRPGSNYKRPSLWSLEAVMLIWELLQSNRKFAAIVGKKYISELMIILLYYVFAYHNQKTFKNLVFLCAYLLLYLSSVQQDRFLEPLFVPLNSATSLFEFYNCLPSNYKLSITPGNTRDFLVTHICTMLINNQVNVSLSNYLLNSLSLSDLLIKTLIEILYNLIPRVSIEETTGLKTDKLKKLNNPNPRGGLSYQSSSLITQLVGILSNKKFLLEKSFHPDLVALLIRAICAAVTKFPVPSRMLLFCILKNEKVYDELWNTIFSFSGVFFRGNSLTRIEDESDELQSENTEADASIAPYDSKKDEILGSTVNPIPIPIPIPTPTNKYEDDGTIKSASAETENIEASLRPSLPTGMSFKAREKLKKDSPLNKTWAGNDALAILLTIVIPHLKVVLNEVWSRVEGSSVDSYELVQRIEKAGFSKVFETNKSQLCYDLLPNTPLDQLKFNWSHLSLGWYISLLYGQIYNSGAQVQNYSGNSIRSYKIVKTFSSGMSKLTLNWTSFLKQDPQRELNSSEAVVPNIDENLVWVNNALCDVNTWSGSEIKLFNVETTEDGFFANLNSRIMSNYTKNENAAQTSAYGYAVPSTPGGLTDMSRRFSDFRINNGSNPSIRSIGNSPAPSALSTPVEEKELYFSKRSFRNSVTSLHSLNNLNRSRSNTPRNSISQ